ncbi:MAG: sigma-70 family RNA polymerase sigma factor [Actinomycetota bacterium]
MRDEDALVHAARAADTEAFGELWLRLAPTVAAYVRSRGVLDVDDVTSEVFAAAFARIGDFVGGGAQFRRFVFTLAHHKAVDDIRRRFGPRAMALRPFEEDADPRRADSAEDDAVRDLYGEQLQRWLGALAPAQREVLLLRVVAGLDVADVAAVLGRSQGAVKQLQHRAITTLRRCAEQEPGADWDAAAPTQPPSSQTPSTVTSAPAAPMTRTT